MQIVIDIPQTTYNHVFDNAGISNNDLRTILLGISKSIILPNGHGRLIDADVFQKYCFNKNFDKRLSEGGLATINMFLDLQPTIIEGDAESEG